MNYLVNKPYYIRSTNSLFFLFFFTKCCVVYVSLQTGFSMNGTKLYTMQESFVQYNGK